MIQSTRPPYSHGICATIAWVHHILGLNVHVYADDPVNSVRFSHERQPLHECSVEIRSDLDGLQQEDEPSIVLFDTSKSQPEEVFTIRRSDDDVALESLRLSAARGYGTRKLIDEGGDGESGHVTMELTLTICGFAVLLINRLQYRRVLTKDTEHPPNGVAISGVSDPGMKKKFCDAASFLFDRDMSSDLSPFNYEAILNHRRAPPDRLESAPTSVRSHFEREGDPAIRRKVWWTMRIQMTKSARLLLALCHVNDITACEGLRLANSAVPDDPTRESMSHPVSSVRPEGWMMMVAAYMEPGFIRDPHDVKRALYSRRGWSVRINTLDLLDASNLMVGGICIEQGKPWCDGICKSHIFNAPADARKITSQPSVDVGPPASDFSSCLVPVTFDKAKIARPADRFVVSLRLRYTTPSASHGSQNDNLPTDDVHIAYSGYRDLYDTRAIVHKTEQCEHPPEEPQVL
ncbi:hypothetical protein LTR95_004427 [Oleoguttula sp. CCFEE 5521]